MVSRFHDIGAYITGRRALANTSVVGGGSGDNTEVDGVAIDRLSDSEKFLSCKVILPIAATMAATRQVTVVSNVQHSSVTASSGFTDYDRKDSTSAYSVTFGDAASTASQTITDVVQYDVDLGAAKRYIRVQATPNMTDTSSADTCTLSGVVVLGGGDFLPPAT